MKKEIMILISVGALAGCGANSNHSSTDNGPGSLSSITTQSLSPGEMAKIQNQNVAVLAPQNFDEQIQKADDTDAVKALYDGFSSPNPAVRKKSEETLTTLVNYDDRYLDDLKKLQAENRNPDTWFAVSLILKDVEKTKAKAKESEIKAMIGE